MYAVRIVVFATKPISFLLVNVGVVNIANAIFILQQIQPLPFHKVDLVDILAVILMMINSSKGISAIDVSRHLNLNYKTAFVLCGKVREALFKTRDLSSLSGEIHEDGMWINFTLRPTNFRKNNHKQRQKADEKGRKYPKFRTTKRCLFAITQRAANDSNISGANRTIVAMDYTENADTVFALNQRFVKAGSDIMCDENPAYKSLDFTTPVGR